MTRCTGAGQFRFRPKYAARLLVDLTGIAWTTRGDWVGAPLPDGRWAWSVRDADHARRWRVLVWPRVVASLRCEARSGEHLEEIVALQVGAVYETLATTAGVVAGRSEPCDT